MKQIIVKQANRGGRPPKDPANPIRRNVNIAMPDALIDRLDREAKDRGVSRSQITRMYILTGMVSLDGGQVIRETT